MAWYVGFVCGFGQVFVGIGQEVVQGELITFSQGEAEFGEQFFFTEKGLGDGREGATFVINFINLI